MEVDTNYNEIKRVIYAAGNSNLRNIYLQALKMSLESNGFKMKALTTVTFFLQPFLYGPIIFEGDFLFYQLERSISVAFKV